MGRDHHASTRPAFAPTPFFCALIRVHLPLQTLPLTETERQCILVLTTEFVCEQLECLPLQLRLALRLGLWSFRAQVRLRARKPFVELSPEDQAAYVHAWAFGPMEVGRQLFRPVRSVALLSFYEREDVQRVLDQLAPLSPAAPPDPGKEVSGGF